MSDARAIAAVTATLKRMVFHALSADPDLSGARVTAKPPDRARIEPGAGNQINLFLYRTSLDAAWRNQDPAGIRRGEQGQPPLPLILSYLLTAYGEDDDEELSHSLLGLGMSVLHDQPLLAPAAIAAALPGTGLETQIERVRITPHPIPMDEISRLWATFQTGYRISVSYDVSVVLIDSGVPTKAPLPVLSRGVGDVGPITVATPAPMITMVALPQGQSSIRPGEQLRLIGQNLGGVRDVVVVSDRMAKPRRLALDAATEVEALVTLPTVDPLPAGTAGFTISTAIDTDTDLLSNRVAVSLAPVLVSNHVVTASRTNGTAHLTLTCSPPVSVGQLAGLVVGDRPVPAEPAPSGQKGPRAQLHFVLRDFDPGTYVLRLRIDGQDSIPHVPGSAGFDERQTLVLT
jgi:hypothetical protein